MMGLAPDGGLFVPERIPQADMAVAERLAAESYPALAGYLAGLFFDGDFDLEPVGVPGRERCACRGTRAVPVRGGGGAFPAQKFERLFGSPERYREDERP